MSRMPAGTCTVYVVPGRNWPARVASVPPSPQSLKPLTVKYFGRGLIVIFLSCAAVTGFRRRSEIGWRPQGSSCGQSTCSSACALYVWNTIDHGVSSGSGPVSLRSPGVTSTSTSLLPGHSVRACTA